MLEYLDDKNLIICPNSLKKRIISELNEQTQLISYKIMSLEEFREAYFFSYDKKAVLYLIKNQNMKLEIALEYLNSLYYVEDRRYATTKLNLLVEIRKELLEHHLLTLNPLWKEYLKKVKILIIGYEELEPFYLKILENYHYQIITPACIKKDITVHEFSTLEEEVSFVCDDMKRKLDQNVPISNLKLITPTEEYTSTIKRIFRWCHLPINLTERVSLYSLKIGKKLLEKIKENKHFPTILEELTKESFNQTQIESILFILNEYVELEELEESSYLYPLIEYDLKHTYLKEPPKKTAIETISIEEATQADYVYLLGFNKENYPPITKDDSFLSDIEKEELGLFTSNRKNQVDYQKLKKNLYTDTNLFVSYKLKTAFDLYNPCLLIAEENLTIEKKHPLSYQTSHFFNQIKLAKELDYFYKYGVKSEDLSKLISRYSNLPYRTYHNQFTGIDSRYVRNHLKKPFTLSYSTIDTYYKCAFRYYIENILNIKNEDIDEFYRQIGNIFHYILSKAFLPNFDFETSWKEEIQKYEIPLSKQLLLTKLKQELKEDIDIIKNQRALSKFDQAFYEKRFMIPISNPYSLEVNMMGVVDKICYLELGNKTLVSVIDYKTGHFSSNLNNVIYGLDMQLPIYLYFIRRSTLFPNTEVVGFYIQKIMNKEGKGREEEARIQREKDLKLVGYSTEKEENLELFDMTYADSQVIQGLKRKKEGFHARAKILTEKEMDKLDQVIDRKIREATSNILEAKFEINPKRIENKLLGCEYCSYQDICYKTENDIVDLEKHKNLDFLGSGTNA